MEKITSSAILKIKIQLLEDEQKINSNLLKEQFNLSYESLKPVNLLLGTLSDITSSPILIDNLSGTVIGLASGYLSKKLIVGKSGNLIRKVIGSILQYGVSSVVAKNSDSIKSFGQKLFEKFLAKRETNSEHRAS